MSATTHANDLEASTRAFLVAITTGASASEIASFYDPQIIQHEFPNALVPRGAKRDLSALLAAHAAGAKAMASQTIDIVRIVVQGNVVIVEALWTGTLAVTFATLQPGDVMRARFAQFFEYRDGLILHQRNYDCFEPWS